MNWAVDLQTATTVLSILGKALVCISFAVVYVHSSEMFPTEVRNVGLGTASMCARISSLAASYVGGPLVGLNLPGSLSIPVVRSFKGSVHTYPCAELRLTSDRPK